MNKFKYGDIVSQLAIIDIAEGGKGLGKTDGAVIFVDNAVPGDILDVRIIKAKRRYYQAEIQHFVVKSEHRTTPPCKHFGTCGGCKWQHMSYTKQLDYKKKHVSDNLSRIAKIEAEKIKNILPSAKLYYYRNKLEFTFTDRRWLTPLEINAPETIIHTKGLGFHIPGKFSKVLDIDECYLMSELSDKIRTAVRKYALDNDYSFFDLIQQKGLLRNMLVRTSTQNELMLIIVFHENDTPKIKAMMQFINSSFPQITSLLYVVNPKRNDTISDLDVIVYKGNDYITEKMGDLTFKIGAKSFFQTNTAQAVCLYNKVVEMAALTGKECVYDLYTGTGTLALFVSHYAHKVIGIDCIEQAIENARENALLNNKTNCSFVAGVIEKIFNASFTAQNGTPDVVITDPPRSGMHPQVIKQLLDTKPERIVYVSCNPATQARDIAMMAEKYEVHDIQPVDMFPHTEHIENIVILIRK